MMMMIEYGYAMNKTDLGVQAHHSSTVGLSAARQCFVAKVIIDPFRVRLRSMSTLWKAYLIRFQIYLVQPQYHISMVFKSSRDIVDVSIRCYDVVASLLFKVGA
jgi:hypothetical protein